MITSRFLGLPHQEHWLGFRSKLYVFPGQKDVEVDRDLATYCSSKIGQNGKPVFKVIGLDGEDPDSDISHVLGVQLEFESWHLLQQ
jgi:hypothetical protein